MFFTHWITGILEWCLKPIRRILTVLLTFVANISFLW